MYELWFTKQSVIIWVITWIRVAAIPKKILTSLGFRKIPGAGSTNRIKIKEKFTSEVSLRASFHFRLTKPTPKYQVCYKTAVPLKPEPTKFKNAEIPTPSSVISSIWISSMPPKFSGSSREDYHKEKYIHSSGIVWSSLTHSDLSPKTTGKRYWLLISSTSFWKSKTWENMSHISIRLSCTFCRTFQRPKKCK